MSQFNDFEKLASSKYHRLLPYYEKYISEVSVDYIAISMELSCFLLTFCDIMNPKNIDDLGTGFSSFVFRHYAAHSGSGVTVWSVDDGPEWLEKTRSFLIRQDLSVQSMET